jgi:hypothetical protein
VVCRVMGKTIVLNVLELVNVKNHFYHKAITMHYSKNGFFHERFQVEINCLEEVLEWYDTYLSMIIWECGIRCKWKKILSIKVLKCFAFYNFVQN